MQGKMRFTARFALSASLVMLSAAVIPADAWGQPYVTARLGYANSDFSLGQPYNGVVDDSAVNYGLDLGMGFGNRMAVEFGVNGYGGFDGRATPCPPGQECAPELVSTSSNDVTLYALSIVPRFTLESVELFARAGYYRADIDADLGVGIKEELRQRGLVLGAGARWYFREPWSVSLHASRFDDNLYQFSVGAGWGITASSQ